MDRESFLKFIPIKLRVCLAVFFGALLSIIVVVPFYNTVLGAILSVLSVIALGAGTISLILYWIFWVIYK